MDLPGELFFSDIVNSALFGYEKVIGNLIGKDAVDLFRHGTVTGTEAAFEVRKGDTQLVGCNGAGQGGVYIPHNHNQIRSKTIHIFFNTDYDFPYIGVGCSRFQFKIRIRLKTKLPEKHIRHIFILMLTGMQDFKIDVGVLADNPGELCDFDEVGAGADDEEEVFHIIKKKLF